MYWFQIRLSDGTRMRVTFRKADDLIFARMHADTLCSGSEWRLVNVERLD
jgi:hypothetical protein